jgi:hypothetical protein
MKFMMIYCTDPELVLDPVEEAELDRELMAWCEELSERGVRLGGAELVGPCSSTHAPGPRRGDDRHRRSVRRDQGVRRRLRRPRMCRPGRGRCVGRPEPRHSHRLHRNQSLRLSPRPDR